MSRGLWRSVAVVSGGTTLSRLLGFVREILMATFFGTELAKSAFDVAFKIPNLFRRLFGEGALSAGFVPVFTETLEKEGREEAQRLASRMISLLGAFLAALVLIGIAGTFAAERLLVLGPKAAAVMPLLRIMLPYTLFICLVAMCMGMLNSTGHFAVPALTPVLLNLFWIAALLFICPHLGIDPGVQIYGVAWAVVLAGVAQLLIQFPALYRRGVRLRLTWRWRDARVRKILWLVGPAALGMGVHQVNVVIDGVLALYVGTWAPAAMTYAERLIYLPLGIIATALGTVLLPTFSRQAATGSHDVLRKTLRQSLERVSIVMAPAAAGLIILATAVVQLVYVWKGGRFDGQSTTYTVRALAFYAPGLLVFSWYKILVPAFYALNDTRTPVRIGLLAVALNLVLNLVCVFTWPDGYQHAGLAFSTVFASLANCVALATLLHRRIGNPGWGRLAGVLLRTLVGVALMAVVVHGVHGLLLRVVAFGPEKLMHAAALLVAIAVGMVVYGMLSMFLFRDETLVILRAARRDRA